MVCIRPAHTAVRNVSAVVHCISMDIAMLNKTALSMCRKVGEFLLRDVCAINASNIAVVTF